MTSVSYLDEFDDLKLMIIGGDEDSQEEINRLKALSFELGLADKIDFRGMVKQMQLPLFYSAADVCVVPSYYESFGLVALESLACGTPVVATNVGNLGNIISNGKNGYILADNNPRKLADGIAKILKEPGIRDRSLSVIRNSITDYSWTKVAEMIVGEFHSVFDRQAIEVF